ncbi:MAG: hypothetical protein KA715_06910 [Xanthomonadaceae bacterium]|nr:hypothetical protein [Xanthomonadaceae bacterium]
MKKLIILGVVFITSASHATVTDSCNRVELKTAKQSESEFNIDFGILFKSSPYKIYDIECFKQGNSKETLGQIILSSNSFGIISGGTYSDDDLIEIDHLHGQKLSSLCSPYYGGNIGGTLVAGGDAFRAINENGITLKSSITTFGIQLDVSLLRIKTTCIDTENKKWEKIIHLE